jgi:hypothetical protein
VKYSELNAELLKRFPELFSGYAQLKAMWDGDEPGPHVVYGDVLVPWIATLFRGHGQEVEKARVFAFLEELATSDAQELRDVLGASVLEGLRAYPGVLLDAAEYMGQGTKALNKTIQDAWG